jgi:hypothetical protein
MSAQLSMFRPYADGVDPATQALLDLIHGDPIHDRDREAVIDAIRAAVRDDGTVCGNDWRRLIPAWVYPRVIGATVNALARAGVLRATGEWVASDDFAGRNSGKPVRVYRWCA